MASRRILALTIALFGTNGIAACGALDDFETTMEDEATIPGSFGMTGPFSLGYMGGFNNIRLSQEKSFQNAGVTPDDVDAIFVKSIRMEGKNPQIDRLDVLIESVEIFVSAEGQPRTVLATKTMIPPMSSAFDLDIAMTTDGSMMKVNLKPFAVAPEMKVGATVNLKRQPTLDTTIKTIITLMIDINLLGT